MHDPEALDPTTVERIERGVAALLGAWISAGVLVDVQRFRKRKQTFSTAIWLLQRNRAARVGMVFGWIALTVHLFIEPFIRAGKAKAMLKAPLPVIEQPLAPVASP